MNIIDEALKANETYAKSYDYPLVLLLLIANTINLGADLGAMASGTQLLVPRANFAFLVIFYAAIILLLVIFVSYKRYARILKWICLSLVTYVLTGFLIPLNWKQVLLAAIVPHIEWNFAFLFLVVGILGTTISPYMIFWEPDEEVEEEIEAGILPVGEGKPKLRKGYIGKMKLDTFVGMLCSEIITFFIIVTTAATLHVHGITNIQALRGHHPAKLGFTIRRILGIGNLWITEYVLSYNEQPTQTVSTMEFRDGKVAHETQYFADLFEAPAWRAQWVEHQEK